MKIYTRKGDEGKTSLIGGTRVSKGHYRIEAYGTVDELNSNLGVVRSFVEDKAGITALLMTIQNDLFNIGSLLAADPEKNKMELPGIEDSDVEKLEASIDSMNDELDELKAFIIPAGHIAVAQCHVARTVCRRAERAVVVLDEQEGVDPVLLKYLNRLSDLLFVLARKIGKDFGIAEVTWTTR